MQEVDAVGERCEVDKRLWDVSKEWGHQLGVGYHLLGVVVWVEPETGFVGEYQQLVCLYDFEHRADTCEFVEVVEGLGMSTVGDFAKTNQVKWLWYEHGKTPMLVEQLALFLLPLYLLPIFLGIIEGVCFLCC